MSSSPEVVPSLSTVLTVGGFAENSLKLAKFFMCAVRIPRILADLARGDFIYAD